VVGIEVARGVTRGTLSTRLSWLHIEHFHITNRDGAKKPWPGSKLTDTIASSSSSISMVYTIPARVTFSTFSALL
jgi:hypothetical protein